MNKKLLMFYLILIVLFSIISIEINETSKVIKNNLVQKKVFVKQVIDGDTIKTDIGDVRFLGINAPEKNKYYYNESKEYLRFIENKTITLIFDNIEKDKYQRYLGYIEYNGLIVNIDLIEKGYASVYMSEGLYYEDKLIRAEKSARQNQLGIWEKSNETCYFCIDLIELDPEQEFFILKNSCNFDCYLDKWYVKDSGRNEFKLSLIKANQEEKVQSKTNIWNNDHDKFFMRDSSGLLALYYGY